MTRLPYVSQHVLRHGDRDLNVRVDRQVWIHVYDHVWSRVVVRVPRTSRERVS